MICFYYITFKGESKKDIIFFIFEL